MKLLFIVNPISGDLDKEPFLEEAKELCSFYGINFLVFKTTGEQDALKLNKILDEFSPDRVASVGGDGTTLFTAISLLHKNIPMGIIPLGSANGMATELYVQSEPIQALKDILLSQMIYGLDLLKVNKEYYSMHIGDVGLNANIVNAYEKDPNRGMITYAKYFLEELQNFENFDIEVSTPKEHIKGSVFMAAICNSRKYGTGVPLNLIGNPMDGKFEIVLMEQLDMTSLIKAGLSAFNEKFYTNQQSKTLVTESATLKFKEPRLLQLDGEVIGKFKTIDIEIVKGAVQLITTKANMNIQN